MTKEEAIKILQNIYFEAPEVKEALQIAIETLQILTSKLKENEDEKKMIIHRKNGEVLEANLINGELVTLKQFKNNSAPHSKCAFFKMTSDKVECTFPKDLTKKCQIQKGTYNGWDTTEYVKTYIGAEDYMCEEIEEIKEPEKATGIEEKQPVEGLEEELKKYINSDEYLNARESGILLIARHFAEWGAEHLKR